MKLRNGEISWREEVATFYLQRESSPGGCSRISSSGRGFLLDQVLSAEYQLRQTCEPRSTLFGMKSTTPKEGARSFSRMVMENLNALDYMEEKLGVFTFIVLFVPNIIKQCLHV